MATSPKFRKKVSACPVRRNKGRKWRRTKEAFYALDPVNRLCRSCLRKGITRAAVVCDHIKPVSERPDLEFELSNLQGLCDPCNDEKTTRENSGVRSV
jgi:5-methylcytosine-specific restriction endonuclease McrA